MLSLLTARKLLTVLTLAAFLALPAAALLPVPASRAAGLPLAENAAVALAGSIFRILDLPVTHYEIDELTTTRHMGRGEIALTYGLAKESGYPVSRILHYRFAEKMGWGKIAKTLGVKLKDASDKADRVLRDGKLDQDADNLKVIIGSGDGDDDDKDDKPGKHGDGKPGKPGKNNGKN